MRAKTEYDSRIMELFGQGKSIRFIARDCHLSTATVHTKLESFFNKGILVRRTEEQNQQIQRANSTRANRERIEPLPVAPGAILAVWNAGASRNLIADHFEIGRDRMSRILRDLGAQPRTHEEISKSIGHRPKVAEDTMRERLRATNNNVPRVRRVVTQDGLSIAPLVIGDPAPRRRDRTKPDKRTNTA